MGAIFQNTSLKKVLEKGKMVENLNKFYEKCSNCALVMKCGLDVASIQIIWGLNNPHKPHNWD